MRLKTQEEMEKAFLESVRQRWHESDVQSLLATLSGDWMRYSFRAAYTLQQEKIEKLEKDNDLKDSWVKHHQKTVEIQLEKVAELNKKIESLKSDLDWITLNCKSGTEYSEFVFNYKMKEIRQRHCLDKSEEV